MVSWIPARISVDYLPTINLTIKIIILEVGSQVSVVARYPSPATNVRVPELPNRKDAAAWMESERANMEAVVGYAAARGWPAPGVAIATAMSGFLLTLGHWTQMRALHVTALDAAQLAGYRRGEAEALTNLGIVERLTGDYEPPSGRWKERSRRAARSATSMGRPVHLSLSDR